VGAFCTASKIGDATAFALKLATEELFTNFVRHNRGGGEHIELELVRTGQEVVLTMTDADVDPFDAVDVPAPDVTLSAQERTPGGLGLHLVRSYMDDLQYSHNDRTLRVTARKRLEGSDVQDLA
jgi:serine/threonine-protein kinase RsbW